MANESDRDRSVDPDEVEKQVHSAVERIRAKFSDPGTPRDSPSKEGGDSSNDSELPKAESSVPSSNEEPPS